MTLSPTPLCPPARPSSNLFANWGNDDLLLTETARDIVADAAPRSFRVLDWPTLRDAFQRRNTSAQRAKKKLNRHGGMGALLSAVGATCLALAPLITIEALQSSVVVLGCSLVLVGGMMGLWHLFGHSGRSKWLVDRLMAERLRQFYFQYLINNLDAATAAMSDGTKLETYGLLREGALRAFIYDTEKSLSARGFANTVRWLADDHDDANAWGQSDWHTNKVAAAIRLTDEQRELFECLSRGRIGIQDTYARLNLKPGTSSQGHMARRVAFRSNIATAVFVASLSVAGLSILFGRGPANLLTNGLISLSGVAAAWGLYFRLVNEGMGYALDAERYELYAEQIDLVRQRFDTADDDPLAKIAALRKLEIYAYREMRQFLRTHVRSRFLG